MENKHQTSGKTIKELVKEGFLFECDPFSKEKQEFEKRVRLTDGYKKVYSMLTKNELTGSDKQVSWALKIRDKKADSLAYEIVSLNVMNEFGGDFDVNKVFATKRKDFSAINAAWWIENRF